MQASIGINTWSSAVETEMSATLNNLNLPEVLVNGKGKQKAAAASLYLRSIVERLKEKCENNAVGIQWDDTVLSDDNDAVKKKKKSKQKKKEEKTAAASTSSLTIYQFINEIVESRYVKMGLIERISGFKTCQFWDHGRCPKQHTFNAVEIRQIKDHSVKIVDHIIIALKQILKRGDKNGIHSTGILGLILGDYIERVATFTVGPERVCPFLRCVSHPMGWKKQELKDRILDWGDNEEL